MSLAGCLGGGTSANETTNDSNTDEPDRTSSRNETSSTESDTDTPLPGIDGTREGATSSTGLGVSGKEGWQCSADTRGCSCTWSSSSLVPGAVTHCVGYRCCLLTEPDDGHATSCSCEDLDADCDAEAATRPGTQVVEQCPPADEDPLLEACAEESINCRASYLEEQGLLGCCPGLICKANDDGVSVCLPPSDDEEAQFAADCEHTVGTQGALNIEQTLNTSFGPIVLSSASSILSTYSELTGGLSLVRFDFEGGGSSCTLDVSARSLQDELGLFEISTLSSNFRECPEFTCDDGLNCWGFEGTNMGTVSFRGLSCEGGNASSSQRCFSGIFTIELTSTSLLDINEQPLLPDGAELTVDGVLCAYPQ